MDAVAHQGHIVAVVERKSLADLVATMTGGKLWYLLADLATHDRAAIVVEDRYSQVFKVDRVRPLVVSEGLGEAAARYPQVPILFCETRQLAMEWSYRFLGAALDLHLTDRAGLAQLKVLPQARTLQAAAPTTKDVRAWARSQDIDVPTGGRLRPEIWDLYRAAHKMADAD